MPPVLPPEIQFDILDIATRDLEQVKYHYAYKWKSKLQPALATFSLVSRSWAADARRLLYHCVALFSASFTGWPNRFYRSLEANPDLGTLVIELDLSNIRFENNRFPWHAHLLPNLRVLTSFWSVDGQLTPPLSTDSVVRPKLDPLVITEDYISGSTLAPWVELGFLRRLEIFGDLFPATLEASSDTLDELYFGPLLQSPLIEELLIDCLKNFPRCLRQFLSQRSDRLRVLTLLVEGDAQPVFPETYQALQRLYLSARQVPDFLRQATFPSLDWIGIEDFHSGVDLAPGWEWLTTVGLDALHAICNACLNHRDRFPILREICIRGSSEGFEDHDRKRIADMLAAVGLNLVDKDGVEMVFT